MNYHIRSLLKSVLCFAFLANSLFVFWGQDLSWDQHFRQTEEMESTTPSPVAVPVLTPEKAETANQEALRLQAAIEEENRITLLNAEEWRRNDYYQFFKRLLLVILVALLIPIAFCFIFGKKKAKKTFFSKAVISLGCTISLLVLLYSAIPYFYDFWSVGNLCLGCIIWYTLFKGFDFIFAFSSKDIFLIPLFLIGAWVFVSYVNPRMRDVPNTIVLDAQTNGDLIYNGTVSHKEFIPSKADFLAHYDYIELKGDWKQTGSYRASLKNGIGRITIHLPTELIQNYCLGINLTSNTSTAWGMLSVNGLAEPQWQTNGQSVFLSLQDYEQQLFPQKKNCPVFFLLLCIIGSILTFFFLWKLIERIYSLYYTDSKQKAFELALLVVCILFFALNLKNAFFIDNPPDYDLMASNVAKRFSTKHPPMIYAWWMASRLISPFESINTAFVFGTLISFWGGIWFLGSYLIRCKQTLFAFLIVLSCVNLASASMYPCLLVDQIVVSTCLLTVGLCTRLNAVRTNQKIVLSFLIVILLLVLTSIRLEGLAYTVPISAMFVSLILFEKKKGFKRMFLSGLIGSVLALSLFSIYRFGLSPYVFHAYKEKNSAIDNLFREALGICYFSQDWDDLPEMFSDDAKKALDRTRFLEQVRSYRLKYLPKASMEQVQDFWLQRIKKHPFTYLKVKWVGNQVLWRCRKPYAVPRDVRIDIVPKKTGLSFADFFREGITSTGLVFPSWIPQLSLLFVSVFISLLLLKFNDNELWIIWGIGASGFLHNFAFFLISGAPNYRYIYWADISGCISFFFSCLVLGKFFEYLRRKHNLKPQEENKDEAVCPNTLFQ